MNCPYCVNGYTGVERKRKELSSREWILGLKNIDTNGKPITLGGGEPTIHPGFYDIINDSGFKITFDLLSNGQFNLGEFIDKASPNKFTKGDGFYKSIRLSYHAGRTKQDELVRIAYILQAKGYSVGIFGLNHPNNLRENVIMTQKCSERGIYFFIRDYLGFYDDRLFGFYKYPEALNGNRKSCLCRPEDFLIGPDGNIYRCHRDLYVREGEIGNILNIAYEHKDGYAKCHNLGLCNPCDIKIKLSNDLQVGKCAVDIKYEKD
jgi:hypothetical protein